MPLKLQIEYDHASGLFEATLENGAMNLNSPETTPRTVNLKTTLLSTEGPSFLFLEDKLLFEGGKQINQTNGGK